MSAIVSRLQAVRDRIWSAAAGAGRDPREIALLAISKTQPAAAIREAYLAGQILFGESYVQEAVGKIDELSDLVGWRAASTGENASVGNDAPGPSSGVASPSSTGPLLRPPEWRIGTSEENRSIGNDAPGPSSGVASPSSTGPLLRPPEWRIGTSEENRSIGNDAPGPSSGVASPSSTGPLLRPPEWRIGTSEENRSIGNDAPGPSSGFASPSSTGPLLRPPEWHFVGPIQSNKTRLIAERFSWVHSVARLDIAERLSKARPMHLPPLQICLQINLSGESSKSGAAPENTLELARAVVGLPHLQLRGLMAIPRPTADFAAQRRGFAQLRELRQELADSGIALDTLSMGMSDDLEAAIVEGSTLVRIGTAIFGLRAHR